MGTDTHLHSSCSDGKFRPYKLAMILKAEDIKFGSLTDHNDVSGTGEFEEACSSLDIKAISGVELSVVDEFEGSIVRNHLLVYGWSYINHMMQRFFADYQESQNLLSEAACMGAQSNPVVLADGQVLAPSFDDIRSFVTDDRVVYLGEIGAYISDKINDLYQRETMRKDILINMFEAFAVFVHANPKYVAQFKDRLKPYVNTPLGKGWLLGNDVKEPSLRIDDAFNWIDGFTVLAHPGEKGRMTGSQIKDARYVGSLVERGLDGVEVFSPKNSLEVTSFYSDLCDHLCLFKTGGSDFHGYCTDQRVGHANGKAFPDSDVRSFLELFE